MFCFDFSLMPLVAESGIFCSCTRVASSVVALLCIHQVPKATIGSSSNGQMSVGQMSVGQMSVGQMGVGQVSRIQAHYLVIVGHIHCERDIREFQTWYVSQTPSSEVSSVPCRRSVVSSGYSGFLHQKTDFIIIISPPWYDPGCCWGIKPQ